MCSFTMVGAVSKNNPIILIKITKSRKLWNILFIKSTKYNTEHRSPTVYHISPLCFCHLCDATGVGITVSCGSLQRRQNIIYLWAEYYRCVPRNSSYPGYMLHLHSHFQVGILSYTSRLLTMPTLGNI